MLNNLISLYSFPLEKFTTLIFFGILIFYVIFTGVLYYHWSEYSTDEVVSNITTIVYLLITLPLIGILGLIALQI